MTKQIHQRNTHLYFVHFCYFDGTPCTNISHTYNGYDSSILYSAFHLESILISDVSSDNIIFMSHFWLFWREVCLHRLVSLSSVQPPAQRPCPDTIQTARQAITFRWIDWIMIEERFASDESRARWTFIIRWGQACRRWCSGARCHLPVVQTVTFSGSAAPKQTN